MTTVSGLDGVLNGLSAAAKRVEDAALDGMIIAGALIEGEAKRSIQEQSPGRKVVRYTEGGNKKNHVAAAAGEAPNTDTGRLVNSITSVASGGAVYVGTPLEYAPDLELGTTKMLPRPFLVPALFRREADARQIIAETIAKALKK